MYTFIVMQCACYQGKTQSFLIPVVHVLNSLFLNRVVFQCCVSEV